MDKPKNKRLVAEKTNELKTVIEDYPDIPDGGLVVKVLLTIKISNRTGRNFSYKKASLILQ